MRRCFVVLLPLLMALGRMLKRRAGVQLKFTYRCFCGVVAVYIPTAVLHLQLQDLGFDLGLALQAMSVLLGAFVVMALMRRYLWEMYFEQTRKVPIPKLLRHWYPYLFSSSPVFWCCCSIDRAGWCAALLRGLASSR